MNVLDPRIVRVSIEVDGVLKIYDGLDVHATGTKYANPNQNECEVKINNLRKDTRDYILTETSPFNLHKKRKKLIVEAGRESYGTAKIFQGDITAATIGQPPDITLTIKAQTGNFDKGKIVGRSQAGQSSLKKISSDFANNLGMTLDFQADDKTISNHSFSGASLKELDKIGDLGNVNAYIDDDTVYVKNYNKPLNGRVCLLDLESGMVGIPQMDEHGLKVQFLLDNRAVLGGLLQVKSIMNPTASGDYVIYKLGFDISNRDIPFYYLAECKRLRP